MSHKNKSRIYVPVRCDQCGDVRRPLLWTNKIKLKHGSYSRSASTQTDPRFTSRATEYIVIRENDLHGNVHPEGLLDQSGARDRTVSAPLPSPAN